MAEFRPVLKCFEKCDIIRAQHHLWEDFQQERTDIKKNGIYKVAFYLFLKKNELKADYGKDKEGNIGYGLHFISKD